MFKNSRRKIVAAILSVLVLVLLGTFCVIYIASYGELTRENRQLLELYVENYALGEEAGRGEPNPERPGGRDRRPPMLELSTFYSVALAADGSVLKVDTADVSALDEDTLTQLAQEILDDGKSSGVRNSLIYQTADKGDYTLVAFLDNTVVLENAGTLLRYTLLFGGVTLVVLFFLARYLANRIVAPMEESYQRQKQFISDAGHELKTPVAVVNANVELLQRELGENPWLANIQYENERMSALILQLLDLARTENVAPPMEDLDWSRLVGGETLPMETVAYEKGLSLESSIAEEIWVHGNGTQLRQLTSILLDNAIRHSRGGSPVCLVLERERGSAVLSVSNEGEEIPPEQRKALFERFYRTDVSRTGGQHYGLGLAIAKAIVTAHRGTIEVQCCRGKVIFVARLPLRK